MPVIDFGRRSYDDDQINMIDKDINRWEEHFTSGKIMRCHYDTEQELEEDWKKYNYQYYELKVIANNMAYRLYGLKNEEIYYKFKRYFLSHDVVQDKSDSIMTYAPKATVYESADPVMQDKQAADIMHKTGYYMITNQNDTPQDLVAQLYRFRSMSGEKKNKADTFSIQIYGKKNEERYHDMIGKLLGKEIIPDDTPIKEIPNNGTEVMLTEEMSFDNNPFTTIGIYEATREQIKDPSVPINEAIMVTDYVLSSVPPITPIEKILRENLIDSLHEKIDESQSDSNYLGLKTPYFLVEEMEDLGVFSKDKNYFTNNSQTPTQWFYNYKARSLGLKPNAPIISSEWEGQIKDIFDSGLDVNKKQQILELGWNPSIGMNDDSTLKTSQRTNGIIAKKIGYDFIDLHEMVNLMKNEPIHETNPIEGLYVVFFSDKDLEPLSWDIPRVCISLNSSLNELHPFTNGSFNSRVSITDFIHKHNVYIKVYAIKFDPLFMNKIVEMMNFFKTHSFDYRFKYGYYYQLCSILGKMHPDIANEKLMCVYLMNFIIALSQTDYKNPNAFDIVPTLANMRENPNDKDHIYLLYNGPACNYTPNQIRNAMNYQAPNLNIIKYDPVLVNYLMIIPIKNI